MGDEMRGGRISRALFGLLAASLASACALTRSEVAVPGQVGTQPEAGIVVTVAAPIDERQFEAAPRTPSIPSLKLPEQISDPQVTARALGRKRGGFGERDEGVENLRRRVDRPRRVGNQS